MLYISYMHALNIPCKLETSGDWHWGAYKWKNFKLLESQNSIFKDYGIEKDKEIPFNKEKFNVANHIRALLDMIEAGYFKEAQGMNNDYICNDKYNLEIFTTVLMFKDNKNFIAINNFMLKGGTALLLCYNLNRFSEDIDLDSSNMNIFKYIDEFCNIKNFTYRKAKDTKTVQRAFIDYGESNKLKIEVSHRNSNISKDLLVNVNGILTYNINELTNLKALAYSGRDKVRDLYDITFIINNYYEKLNEQTKMNLETILSYKGIEQYDYFESNSITDDLIDMNELSVSFLKAYEKITGISLNNDNEEEEER